MNDTALTWKAHWPGFEDCCEQMAAHDMYLVGSDAWSCRGCGAWFGLEDSDAMARYMWEANELLHRGRYDGGTPQRFISPTF